MEDFSQPGNMPAQVYFKFKSQLKFDPIPFDGLTITVKEIRKSIVAKKKMKIDESDLQLFNAASNEEYTSDDTLIPENTSLVVARLPRGSGSGPKVYNPNDKTTSKANNTVSHVQTQLAAQKEIALQSAINIQTKIPDALASATISKMAATEEEKIATVQHQSASDYDSSKWMSVPPKPPASYICHFCGLPGHFIKYCTYQGAKTTTAVVKKATGIPMAHTKPAAKDTPGALLTANGEYVVPIIDSKAFKEGKVEKPPFVDSESDDESKNNAAGGDNHDRDAGSSGGVNSLPGGDFSSGGGNPLEVPKLYKCDLCGGPYRSAVITPCCGESFCDECVTDKLLKNDKKCHVCGSTINADSLIPNKSLRDAVIKWHNDNGGGSGSSSTHNSSLLMPPKGNSNLGFSPAGSPHYNASGNSSPQTGNRTPHKNNQYPLVTPNDSSSSDSGDGVKSSSDAKTVKSLSSQLQIVEEETSSSSIELQKEKKEEPSASVGGVGLTRKLSSGSGLSGSGVVENSSEEKSMLRKTLSDLYGAINWEDVNTNLKNSSSPKLNNNLSSVAGKLDNDSSSSLLTAVVNNENSSSMKSINDKNVVSSTSKASHESTRVESCNVEAATGALPCEKSAVSSGVDTPLFSTSVNSASSLDNAASVADKPKDTTSKDTNVSGGGTSSNSNEHKPSSGGASSSGFSLANLSQSDAELLKALLLGAEKVASEKDAGKSPPSATTLSPAKVNKMPPPQPQLPFPPPHLMPPPVPQNSAAALWAATNPVLHPALNPLHMMPTPFSVPMPPTQVSTASVVPPVPVGPPVVSVVSSGGAPSVESLLGMSFKKPLTEQEFYARQKEELSRDKAGSGGGAIKSAAAASASTAPSSSSVVSSAGDASIKRLEAKLREQQLLQQLTSADNSLRDRDRKMRKAPRRKRSSSPRPLHSSKRHPRDYRELSHEKKTYRYARPAETSGGVDRRVASGASRRYHPYSSGGERIGGGRKRSRSRSYYSRTPSPRRHKKYPAEKECRDSIEEALQSARKQVDRLRERLTPEKMDFRKTKSKGSRRPKVESDVLFPASKRKRVSPRGSFSPGGTGDRNSRSPSKSRSPKSDRGYSSHSEDGAPDSRHSKNKERRVRPKDDRRRRKSYSRDRDGASRDRSRSRSKTDSRSSDIRVIEKDSSDMTRRKREANDDRRRSISHEDDNHQKLHERDNRQNSMTPTLDEEPDHRNDKTESPGRESESPSHANPMLLSDFSMLATAGMEFETEEDRKLAVDILRQAHEKIMEHKRKAMKSKVSEHSSSDDKTGGHNTADEEKVEEKLSDEEKGVKTRKSEKSGDHLGTSQNVIVGYAESPDIALEPRGEDKPSTDSMVEENVKSTSKSRDRRNSKDENRAKHRREHSKRGSKSSEEKDLRKSLVQYGSEEDASSDANKDDISQDENASTLTKRTDNGSNETPYSPRQSDHDFEKEEPSFEESEKGSFEASKKQKTDEKDKELRSTDPEKYVDKEVDRKPKETSANSENDSLKRSTNTSQASDYDHPQLSADEILAISQGADKSKEKPEKEIEEDTEPVSSPSKKSSKKLRVEPVSKERETSSREPRDDEDEIKSEKKSKKEKKSKSKKLKDRKSSVDSSVGTPKKESKIKKKKKKKSKDGKKYKESPRDSYREDDVTGESEDDSSQRDREQQSGERTAASSERGQSQPSKSTSSSMVKPAVVASSVIESSSSSPKKHKKHHVDVHRSRSPGQRRRRDSGRSRSGSFDDVTPERSSKHVTSGVKSKAVENAREYTKERQESEERSMAANKKNYVSSTVSSKIVQSTGSSASSSRKKEAETTSSKRRHSPHRSHRHSQSRSSVDYDPRDESPRHRRKGAPGGKKGSSREGRGGGEDSRLYSRSPRSPSRSVSYTPRTPSRSKERYSHSSASKKVLTKTKVAAAASPPRRKVREVVVEDRRDYSEGRRKSSTAKQRPREYYSGQRPKGSSRGHGTTTSRGERSSGTGTRRPDKEAQYSEISFSETEGNRSDDQHSYTDDHHDKHHHSSNSSRHHKRKQADYDDVTSHKHDSRSPRHKKQKQRHPLEEQQGERSPPCESRAGERSRGHHHRGDGGSHKATDKERRAASSVTRSRSPSSSRHSRKDKRKR